MDVAVIGAAGACGRQLVTQLLDREVLGPGDRLQLVGHEHGRSADELWGLRVDLHDAFADRAPSISTAVRPEQVGGDVVVMLAGATVSTDPTVVPDRAALSRTNDEMFRRAAEALAARPGPPPLVIVQSNPVELGVARFAAVLGRHRVVGAGAWSDTLRFRREVAHDLGVRRPAVEALVRGQHGDHAVPVWSGLAVDGVDEDVVRRYVAAQRAERSLLDLPGEIRAGKAAMLERVGAGEIEAAYVAVQALPPDARAGVKPFFTHFTAGHTTEIATAHAVADLVGVVVGGVERVVPAQVVLDGELDGLRGVGAVPVRIGPSGWDEVVDPGLAPDEREARVQAFAAASVQ